MSTCNAKHPQHGVPCEGEAVGHLGRHFSTWPYREWGEFVSADGTRSSGVLPLTGRIGTREGTQRAFEQDGARYDYDRGREAWRPAGDDRMHWWVR